jgi:lipopolysaccharide transport system ATP-binding protein
MYLRLAFAVAAHLEPEILIVDEVLAVGDAVFQKKCLGKMENITQEGRTVLLVSHNMGAIENLCTSTIWLDEGRMVTHGDTVSTISSYLKSSASVSETSLHNRHIYSTGEACITDVRLLDAHGMPADIFRMGETIIVEFDVEFSRYFDSIDLTLWIKRMDIGMKILHMVNQDCGCLFEKIAPGKRRFRVEIPYCLLYPASYKISLWVGLNGGNIGLDFLEDILSFTMVQSNVTMRTSPLTYSKQAIFYMPSQWQDIT